MRRLSFPALATGLLVVCAFASSAVARELITSIDLDYGYSQANLGGDVNAATSFNQKYEVKYETSLTTAHDFIGAVRVELQDAWYTDLAATSRVAPTLEMATKSSRLAAKIAYEVVIGSTETFREVGEVNNSSSSISFGMEVVPELLPVVNLKYQRRGDYQDYAKEGTTTTFEFSTRKDIYGVRLEYNFSHNEASNALPARTDSAENKWSAKATYKEILWYGAEFELAYEINESYKSDTKRGLFSGETSVFNQLLKTRLKNSLVIAPRITLGLVWEYQFEQDLLGWDYDFKLKNKYAVDMRWDAFESLKITTEARRETDLTNAIEGEEDERSVTDGLRAGFDLTSISWLRLSGKAELKKDEKILEKTGGSVDKVVEEKYELVAKNRIGEFWDLTVNGSASTKREDDWLTTRETRVKTELKLKLLEVIVTPTYEVSRINEWERPFLYPMSQTQTRDAKIKFEYRMQLLDLFKATFFHEYGIKIEDTLDEVLNFDRELQFNESTRVSIILAEIVRGLRLEAEAERKASDAEGDPDPQLVELSYALKLDWKYEQLSVLSSIKYNDKGDTFDDLSFNAKAGWRGEQLEITGEYQFDKILVDFTEPKDEKRKLSLRLSYKY